ncbi:MAG: DUF2935 domain-containing protein [Oscillospiraceae bacterium]|jgi:hypothetical protein
MITEQQYVVLSLELHLFFGRIMKEHALFLRAGFTPRDAESSRLASQFQTQFEGQLQNAVALSDGVIRSRVLHSGELFTDYTLGAEQKTQNFTAIPINQGITVMETRLHSGENPAITPELLRNVRSLNAAILPLLDSFIQFKTTLLNNVLSCNMFTMNYPLLIDHILREAKMYRSHLVALESGNTLDETIQSMELFWDQIMLEHALFIRGLLDPSEGDLVNTANDFALEYGELLQKAQGATDMMLASITGETLALTTRYRDFKAAGTAGIAECKIRSIILPLLGDHVLREANHYLRLLGEQRTN